MSKSIHSTPHRERTGSDEMQHLDIDPEQLLAEVDMIQQELKEANERCHQIEMEVREEMTQEMDEQLRELEGLLQQQFQEQIDDANARFAIKIASLEKTNQELAQSVRALRSERLDAESQATLLAKQHIERALLDARATLEPQIEALQKSNDELLKTVKSLRAQQEAGDTLADQRANDLKRLENQLAQTVDELAAERKESEQSRIARAKEEKERVKEDKKREKEREKLDADSKRKENVAKEKEQSLSKVNQELVSSLEILKSELDGERKKQKEREEEAIEKGRKEGVKQAKEEFEKEALEKEKERNEKARTLANEQKRNHTEHELARLSLEKEKLLLQEENNALQSVAREAEKRAEIAEEERAESVERAIKLQAENRDLQKAAKECERAREKADETARELERENVRLRQERDSATGELKKHVAEEKKAQKAAGKQKAVEERAKAKSEAELKSKSEKLIESEKLVAQLRESAKSLEAEKIERDSLLAENATAREELLGLQREVNALIQARVQTEKAWGDKLEALQTNTSQTEKQNRSLAEELQHAKDTLAQKEADWKAEEKHAAEEAKRKQDRLTELERETKKLTRALETAKESAAKAQLTSEKKLQKRLERLEKDLKASQEAEAEAVRARELERASGLSDGEACKARAEKEREESLMREGRLCDEVLALKSDLVESQSKLQQAMAREAEVAQDNRAKVARLEQYLVLFQEAGDTIALQKEFIEYLRGESERNAADSTEPEHETEPESKVVKSNSTKAKPVESTTEAKGVTYQQSKIDFPVKETTRGRKSNGASKKKLEPIPTQQEVATEVASSQESPKKAEKDEESSAAHVPSMSKAASQGKRATKTTRGKAVIAENKENQVNSTNSAALKRRVVTASTRDMEK